MFQQGSKSLFLSLFVLIGLVITNTSNAQQLAFPGAEGGGRFAVGGRGGTVYEVTNLNDAGAGSLRDAISQPNRTIVFRVSGIIRLASRLTIKQNNLTIAGQTAPGDGIMITGNTVNISANNIIVRYIRCRLTDVNDIVDDAMNSFSSDLTFPYHDNIIDHCSMGWSVDETGSFYGNKNFTLQWCVLTESLYNSVHNKGVHGYGGIWGGYNATFHHNLIAHHTSRNPRFGGSRYTGRPDLEIVDFRNNVLYNWGNINSAYGGEGGNYNMVNNYYKPGPATPGNLTTSSSSNKRNRILNYTSYYYASDAAVYPDTVWGGKFYINGNYVDGYPDVSADNWTNGVQKDGYAKVDSLMQAARQTSPFATEPVTTQTAQDAYQSVLSNVGAILPHRDALDTRLINETRTGTATYEGATYATVSGTGISHPSGIIDTQDDAGGLPSYNSATPPVDSDHDGMSDDWENNNGLNPNDANDRNTIGANGYTNLENYLNSIASSGTVNTTPTLVANGTFISFSQTLGTPSAVQTFTAAGNNLTGNVSFTAPAGFEISLNGTTWNNSTAPLTVTPTNGILATTKISVRLNASVASSYSGNIVQSSGGAQPVSIFVTGTATSPAPPSSSIVLQQWFLTANNNDDAGSRSVAVVPSIPGFNKFASADSALSPYTSTTGQAFAPTSKGAWTTSANGPGGNLNRTFYEQFTVSASAGYSVRLDSILLNAVFYASQSNTKLAVVYSKTAFTTADSTEVTGASFASPILLSQYSSTNYPRYSLALSGANGVVLTAGQTITIRVYFSCGSTSLARFALVKNIVIKGVPTATAPLPTLTIAGTLNNFIQSIGTASAAQTFTISGSNLNGNVTVTAPAGYEVSGDGANWSSPSITLTPTSGSVAATTVSVRLNATAAGSYSGNITVNSSGATDAIVAVNGTVTSAATLTTSGTLSNFTQTVGAPSAQQIFTVAGSNLTGGVSITPPSSYEVSANGTNWFTNASPLTLTPSQGSIASTSISVRLNAATAGSYSGNIAVVSAGATTNNITATGMAFSSSTVTYSPADANVVVAKDGSGNYTTIQAAINAAPANSTTPYIIYIKNGKYLEKVNVPSNKPFIHLIGESAANTIISWDSYSGKIENGLTIGTSTSATLTVNANDFYMMSITVENASGYVGDGPQALALYVVGDRCAYKNCRFISGQDTIWHNGDGKRDYFKNCYIDGNTDFIFGGSTAVFDSCVIYPRDRIDGSAGGYITAANTSAGQPYGEVFRDCKITKNRGITYYSLGRPWQNDAATVDKKNNKTVFLNTTMGSSIQPTGWSVWDAGTNTSLITYAEYNSRKFDGTPVDVNQRLSWSKQLTSTDAVAYYNNTNLFGTWDPCSASPSLCANTPTELVLSNFRAQRGASNSTLSWNMSWPMSGVTYELYRSTDSINYTKINQVIGGVDSVVAFSVTDATPAKGTVYYYYVKASKDGYAANNSYVAVVDPSLPFDGEFRSAGSGFWTNASSGNGANTASIWEKYVSSSKSWVLQPLGTQPNSVNVTIRAGHTVLLDGLKNANNLTIETGGVLKSNGGYSTPATQTLRIGAGSAASVLIQNDGVFGGDASPDNLILIEFNTACASVLWTGNGTSKITRIRPLPANTNPLSVVFDQDISLSYNSGAITAYYNSTSNANSENVTYTINAGKSIKLTDPAGSFSPTGSATANAGGSYTYNINGTLDLSASTTTSNVVPFSTNASSVVAVNVGKGGALKLGAGFNTVNSAPSTTGTNGKVVLTVADGGLVDASKTTNLNLGTNYFITTGSGALKRNVGGTATIFPIGTSATSYTPVTLTNTGTADNFSVSVKDTFDVKPADVSRVVNKQWQVIEENPGGSNISIKLQWLAADQATGFDPAGFVGIIRNNSQQVWEDNKVTVTGSGTTTNPYSATASGFTSLSQFGVSNIQLAPSITVTGGTYTYDGNQHASTASAFGIGGTTDVLTPAVIFTYEGRKGISYGPTDIAPANAGEYKVTASFAGNTNYTAVSDSSQTIIINQRSIAITAEVASKTYGDIDPALTYKVTAGSLLDGDSFTGELIRDAGENAGTYSIKQGSLILNSNYAMTYNSNNFSIMPRQLVVTANDQTKECGSSLALGTTAFTASGLVFDDAVNQVTLSSTANSVGSYPIVPGNAVGSGLSNYTITYKNGNLIIKDATRPVPDVAQLPDVTGECSVTITAMPTATDACAGKIMGKTTDALNYNQQGTYTITWSFNDGNGNVTIQTQKVIVKDVTKPVITYAPIVPVQCYNPAGTYTIPQLTATDNCGAVDVSYVISGATTRTGNGTNASGNYPVGTSTINWTINDGNGNQTTCQTTVIVNSAISATIPAAYSLTKGVEANTVYIGYTPASSITLTAQASGGNSNLNYQWSNGATATSITVSPTSSASYTCLVKDGYGCINTVTTQVKVVDLRCGNNDDKVQVCNSNNGGICVSADAVPALLNNGGNLGSCANNTKSGISVVPLTNEASVAVNKLTVKVASNPTDYSFALITNSNSSEPLVIRVSDAVGRVIERKVGVVANGTLTLGDNYRPGIYYAEVVQQNQRVVVKLVKQAP